MRKAGGTSSSKWRIALATCDSASVGKSDEKIFHHALEEQSIAFEECIWNDPNIDWASFDLCLIRTTWNYQEHFPAFQHWLKNVASKTLLFNPLAALQWNSNKCYLKDLEGLGAPIAPTSWISPGQRVDLHEKLRTRGWKKAFLKPSIGANASGTLAFDNSRRGCETAQRHLEQYSSQTMMLQPYLSSVEEEGELSLIYIDQELSHGVQKIPLPGDYRVQDDWGAKDMPYDADEHMRECAVKILELTQNHLDIDLLYARVDFLRDHKGMLMLNELELIEPALFFRHGERAAHRMVQALLRVLESSKD